MTKLRAVSEEKRYYSAIVEGNDSGLALLHRTHDRGDINPYNMFAGRYKENSTTGKGHTTCKCNYKGCTWKCLVRCGSKNCKSCNKKRESQLGYLYDENDEKGVHKSII
jgi:hypothetical protein